MRVCVLCVLEQTILIPPTTSSHLILQTDRQRPKVHGRAPHQAPGHGSSARFGGKRKAAYLKAKQLEESEKEKKKGAAAASSVIKVEKLSTAEKLLRASMAGGFQHAKRDTSSRSRSRPPAGRGGTTARSPSSWRPRCVLVWMGLFVVDLLRSRLTRTHPRTHCMPTGSGAGEDEEDEGEEEEDEEAVLVCLEGEEVHNTGLGNPKWKAEQVDEALETIRQRGKVWCCLLSWSVCFRSLFPITDAHSPARKPPKQHRRNAPARSPRGRRGSWLRRYRRTQRSWRRL